MLEMNTFEALRMLRAYPAEQRRACDRLLAGSEPVARRGRCAYAPYLARKKMRDDEGMRSFVPVSRRAWRDSLLYSVNGPGSLRVIPPETLSRTLLLGWHFPAYAAMVPEVVRNYVLVLVASDEPWMEDLRRTGCVYNFRREQPSTALPRAFLSGRPVFAMIDHCYRDTQRCAVGEFLGHRARTPAGVLDLAKRNGYRIGLVSERRHTVRAVCWFEAVRDVEELAGAINARVEKEILRRPAQWLLWPSATERWIDVDYGDAQ